MNRAEKIQEMRDRLARIADLVGTKEATRYCASCNEREGSEYAKHCCTDDNMIDDGGEDE